MTTQESQAAFVLNGLLRCAYCGNALRVQTTGEFEEATYRCPACVGDRSFPTVPARKLETWVLGAITNAVMSESNTRTLTKALFDAGDQLPVYAPEMLRDPVNHPETVRLFATDPTIYTIPENIPLARTFLSKLIDRIDLGNDEVVIHYSLPLPQDSILPGSYRQHLRLTADKRG